MKFLKVVFSLAVALSFAGGVDAKSIKEARAAGRLKVKIDKVVYSGESRLIWKLDSWEGIVELARDYPNLEVLHLADNKLTSLPPEIGQLKNLRELSLPYNKLTSLPPQIGQLKNLRELSLPYNKLTSLPPQIGQLKNLRVLSLFTNKLTSLPREIGQLKNLNELHLSRNKLTSLPREIGQLKNLKQLYLAGNKLNNAQALGVLAKMKWLHRLHLRFNRLSLKQRRWIKRQLPNTKVTTGLLGASRGKG